MQMARHIQISTETIYTKRLRIAPLGEEDKEALIALFRNAVVAKTYMVPELDTKEKAEKLFLRLLLLSRDSSRFVRGIYLYDTMIGIINDVGIEDCCLELGYALHPDYHNNGYMSEVLSDVLRYLKDLGFTVRAGAFSENIQSIRVMEKAGMHRISYTERVEYRKRFFECVFYEFS